MKYGICQWNLPVKGPKGCYELVKLGLDGMELNYSYELVWNLRKYRKISKETGIQFPTLGMNIFCKKSYTCEGSGEFFEKTIKRALKCASLLEVKTLQIPAFFASDISDEKSLKTAAQNLKKACEMTEPYGIFIGTENALDEYQNKELFHLVDHPMFRFYFDNQNLWRMKGISCMELLQQMKDMTVEAHAKDSLIIDGNQKWMPLGEGDAEFASSMDFLKENGFQGWVHLENDYQIEKEYTYAIKKDLESLKSIFERRA